MHSGHQKCVLSSDSSALEWRSDGFLQTPEGLHILPLTASQLGSDSCRNRQSGSSPTADLQDDGKRREAITDAIDIAFSLQLWINSHY